MEQLRSERATLKIYIRQKVELDEDWHAVADAAMDLREIDRELLVLQRFLNTPA